MEPPALRLSETRGRLVVAAAALASGVALLDGTVVNAAIPALSHDLSMEVAGQQWVITGYLLTLSSFIVLGGSLGDRYGRRRVFLIGMIGFAGTSALCGIAPTAAFLVAGRLLQGVAAALLVPGSLAIISASFHPDDRAKAIGAWSGFGGVATAIGPFLGGWLISAASWRWVFLINAPLVVIAVILTLRAVPETRDEAESGSIDYAGAVTLSFGLAAVVYVLIEGPAKHWPTYMYALAAAGAVLLVAFIVIEQRVRRPMVPLVVFRDRQFSGANAVTLVVYAALGAATFFLVVYLQEELGYSPLEASASLLPIAVLMFFGSQRSAALAQRIGPRIQMSFGPVVIAAGLLLLARINRGDAYWTAVFPGTVILAVGLTIMVAPLTATVLGAIDVRRAGIGSAINNAVARLGGLLAVATLPAIVGVSGSSIAPGYTAAMRWAAVLALVGAIVAWATIRNPLRDGTVRAVPDAEVCGGPPIPSGGPPLVSKAPNVEG